MAQKPMSPCPTCRKRLETTPDFVSEYVAARRLGATREDAVAAQIELAAVRYGNAGKAAARAFARHTASKFDADAPEAAALAFLQGLDLGVWLRETAPKMAADEAVKGQPAPPARKAS